MHDLHLGHRQPHNATGIPTLKILSDVNLIYKSNHIDILGDNKQEIRKQKDYLLMY